MQPIETAFEDRTFHYVQLERQGDIAIYEQRHKAGGAQRYEVVRIGIQKEHTGPTGVITPEKEAYPPASQWGKTGLTCFTFAEAQAKLADLLAMQEISPDDDLR